MSEPTFTVTTQGFPVHTVVLDYGNHLVKIAPTGFRIDPQTGAAKVTLVTGEVLTVSVSDLGSTVYSLSKCHSPIRSNDDTQR